MMHETSEGQKGRLEVKERESERECEREVAVGEKGGVHCAGR